MNYLAAIDLEVLVWGVLAVIWVIAQIVGQFNGSDKKGGPKPKNRENMPSELREFLEGIERQAKGEEQEAREQRSAAPPTSPQSEAVQPSPPQRPRPATSQPRSTVRRDVGKAAASSVKSVGQAKRKVNRQSERIAEALEERKRRFNRQTVKQAKHLDRVLGQRFNTSFNQQDITDNEGKIQKVGQVRSDEHEGVNNIGIQGFKLPSLSLPAASDLVSRETANTIGFNNPSDARRALIEALVIAPSVANQPPGSTELNKND